MSISNKKIDIISNYVFDNFNNERMKLINYLSSIIDEILETRVINLSDEEIGDLCWVESNSFIQVAKNLINMSNEKKFKSNIIITNGIDYYIENTIFGTKRLNAERDTLINVFNKIGYLPKKKKGDIFERFCSLFLEDIGVESEVTPSTGDEGVDILGTININVDNPFFKFVFDSKIYLLAQVKCYDENRKVDTPIIRHLIGDGVFYKNNKFNNKINIASIPLYLMIFSYSGFTNPAKNFAKENNVVVIKGNEMIDIICNFDDFYCLKSVKYLLAVSSNHGYMSFASKQEGYSCK